jgi:hypothetical protein
MHDAPDGFPGECRADRDDVTEAEDPACAELRMSVSP